MLKITDIVSYLMLLASAGILGAAMVSFANMPAPTADRYRATFMDAAGNEFVADYGLTLGDCADRYLGQGYACQFTP